MPGWMRVAIRADASAALGSGHIRRCLSLASALHRVGADVRFMSRAVDDVAPSLLADWPHNIWLLEGTAPAEDAAESARALGGWAAHWVVVDHYGLDASWHEAIRQRTGARVAVIDDLADRPLAPDVLVDPNLQPTQGGKYVDVLRRAAKCLTGPRYALLEATYEDAPRYQFREEVRSIGIFMGGTDPSGACLRALIACRQGAGFTGEVEIVSSPLGPHHARLARLCLRWPATRLLDGLPDMAGFFARHDLQVGAGGGATWERCCIGAPTVACMVADNQRATLPLLQAAGAVAWVRDNGMGLEEALSVGIGGLLVDATQRRVLGERARGLVDGRGARRVAAVLALRAGGALQARPAQAGDEALLLGWANDPQVRAQAFNPALIEPAEHAAWLAARLASPQTCGISIVTGPGNLPVGQVRLEKTAHGWEIGYSLDDDFRGLGLGVPLLQAGLAAAPAGATLIGRVKLDNLASTQVFRRLGYDESVVTDGRGPHRLFTRPAALRGA